MYAVDAETQEITNLGVLASSWQWSDTASAPHYGPDEAYIMGNSTSTSTGNSGQHANSKLYTLDTATGKGPPGMIFNYIRGAFYVPASYTAPAPGSVSAEPAAAEIAAPAAEVRQITVSGDAAVAFDVTAEADGFVPGTETAVSSVIDLTTDIRDLTVRSVGSTNAVTVETAAKRSEVSTDAAESTVTETGVELKLTETVAVTNGKLAPSASANRAQIATILMRFCQQ